MRDLEDLLHDEDPTELLRRFRRIAGAAWYRRFRFDVDEEEAIQAALVDCWRRRDDFDPERGKAISYFYVVATSAIRNLRGIEHRRSRAIPTVELGEAFERLLEGDEPTAPLLSEELEEGMCSLDDRERDVLRRRFWEGEEFRKIGADLGLSAARIHQIQVQALAKIREKLTA